MADQTPTLGRKLANRLFVYFGGSWLVVEVFNFTIDRYSLDPVLLDHLILITLFGLPSTLIYSFFNGRFNKVALGLQVINVIGMAVVLVFFLVNPLTLNPGKLRLVKLYERRSSDLLSLNSVAVLPFSNNMGNDSQDYLLAGMHDGLINEIGQLGSIHIISKTSSLPYQNTSKDIQTIAKELDVDAIIETSVTKVDTLIELRINLINAFPDELVIWNHSYTTSLNGLPNLYKEVTKNVALKINNALQPDEKQKLRPKRSPNPGAYEASLRGGYYMGLLTKEGLKLAETQFKNAIEIDSLFAPSYSGLALVLSSSRQMGYVSGVDVNPTIDSLLLKAHGLDSLDSFVLLGMAAELTWGNYEWEEAEKYFKKSININPNFAGSRNGYAHYLMIHNRWEEAWEQMDYALAIDPQDPWVIAFSAAMYFYDGKLLSAAKHAERLIQIAPNHPMANNTLLDKHIFYKNYDQAIIEFKKFVGRTAAPDINSIIDDTYQNKGFKAALKESATYLEKYSIDHFVAPNIIHHIFELLDDTDKRLEWMLKMYEFDDPYLPYYAIQTGDPIQKNSTYQLIMKEIGLW